MDDPINMAVMDTLQDLLYAVAEGRGCNEQAQGCDGVNGKWDDGAGKEKRVEEEQRRVINWQEVLHVQVCLSH